MAATVTARAAGGPVSPHGTYLVGEQGPEILQMGKSSGTIIPNVATTGGGSAGVRLLGVSEQQIIDMVDRGLYFRLQRAAPTLSRT